MARKPKEIAEFGDFQTPPDLADRCTALLRSLGVNPKTVIEPSCGRGAFLVSASTAFAGATLIGLDINIQYLSDAEGRLSGIGDVTLIQGNFFDQDWEKILQGVRSPLLVLGNPPWVTSAELGSLGSANVPLKSNFQKHSGLDAITGKGNFDISEWMLLKNIEWVRQCGGTVAVLCKTSVARKIVTATLKQGMGFADARIYRIDALGSFGAAVDACLFYLTTDGPTAMKGCAVYDSLESSSPSQTFGYADGKLVSNLEDYTAHKALYGSAKSYVWRSGVKHDCSKVMEFTLDGNSLRNGFGDIVDIEDAYLYPLVKSSDISGVRNKDRRMFVLVTQSKVGEDTGGIRQRAPRTWAYLEENGQFLDQRTSVIYKNKPRFSMFGVGDYTFAPWKLAISGMYKKLAFKTYGSTDGKPTVFDDTVYFLPFRTEEEAETARLMLHSDEAQRFLESMIFWDEKRPITVDVLKRLDMAKLADMLGQGDKLGAPFEAPSRQFSLLDGDAA